MSTNKPQIRVVVEVTEEIVMDGKKQVAYVHLGGNYPEKQEIWCPDSGPYRPGNYVATECYLSNEKYPRLLIGLNRLQPLKAA